MYTFCIIAEITHACNGHRITIMECNLDDWRVQWNIVQRHAIAFD